MTMKKYKHLNLAHRKIQSKSSSRNLRRS